VSDTLLLIEQVCSIELMHQDLLSTFISYVAKTHWSEGQLSAHGSNDSIPMEIAAADIAFHLALADGMPCHQHSTGEGDTYMDMVPLSGELRNTGLRIADVHW